MYFLAHLIALGKLTLHVYTSQFKGPVTWPKTVKCRPVPSLKRRWGSQAQGDSTRAVSPMCGKAIDWIQARSSALVDSGKQNSLCPGVQSFVISGWVLTALASLSLMEGMRARGRGGMEFEGWGRIRTQNYQCKRSLRVFLDLEKNSHFKNYTFLKVDKYHLYHKIIKITCIFIISLLKYFRNSFFFALVVICIFHLETPIPEG